MSEPTPLYDAAARMHLADQAEAGMGALGRQYAAFYSALVAGGVPPGVAADCLHRQQMAACQAMLYAQAGR